MHGTFEDGRPTWLDRLDRVRNVVRQELITRQLRQHLPRPPATVLDVGAGQGTQSLRLARAGYDVTAVEPDPEMRAAFEANLQAEPHAVRTRVRIRPDSVAELGATDDRFDVVLLLGVLMYLPDPSAALDLLASRVQRGGLLTIALRTTTSAVWRPAARQDWFAAQRAISEYEQSRAEGRDMHYINEIGAPARAQPFDALVALVEAYGLRLEQWYGIRIAVDSEETDPAPPSDPVERAAMLDVEEHLASTDPFRQLGQLAHLVFRRPDAP